MRTQLLFMYIIMMLMEKIKRTTVPQCLIAHTLLSAQSDVFMGKKQAKKETKRRIEMNYTPHHHHHSSTSLYNSSIHSGCVVFSMRVAQIYTRHIQQCRDKCSIQYAKHTCQKILKFFRFFLYNCVCRGFSHFHIFN